MKTILLSLNTATDDSVKIANRAAYHLKRHGFDAIVTRQHGYRQILKVVDDYKADVSVSLNIGSAEGGGIGVYCNGKGLDIAHHISEQMDSIQKTHEVRQPSLFILQHSPCQSIMINDHRKEVNTDEMASQIVKGILDFYKVRWRKLVKKGAKHEDIHKSIESAE